MSKQKLYAKGLTALAVAAAMSAAHAQDDEVTRLDGTAHIDGWGYSAQGARAAALQLDYFGLEDSFNVWANPALARQYGDRAVVHFTRGDAIQAGGLFYNWGTQTFGAYIGRPSVAADSLYRANDLYDGDDVSGLETPPENQFDLFWAGDFGAAVVGARLNYQAYERTVDNNPQRQAFFFDVDTSEQGNYLPPLADDFNGEREVDEDRTRTVTDASELNLTVGFQLTGLPIDGALTLGVPSRSWTQTVSGEGFLREYVDGDLVEEEIWNFNDVVAAELDGAGSMGIALRGRFLETERSHLLVSARYAQIDNSYQVSFTERSVDQDFDADRELTAHEEERFSGNYRVSDETTRFGLNVAAHLTPQAGTRVIGAIGLRVGERDMRARGSVTENVSIDHLAEEDGTEFDGAYGTFFDVSASRDEFAIPVTVALEHALNERWTARASARKDLYQSVETTVRRQRGMHTVEGEEGQPDTFAFDDTFNWKSETVWDTDTEVALGLGYAIGQFSVDAVVTKRFLTTSLSDNGPFANVTLGYRF